MSYYRIGDVGIIFSAGGARFTTFASEVVVYAAWESAVTTTFTQAQSTGGFTPTLPEDVSSTDLLVMVMSAVDSSFIAGLTIPTGWTKRAEVHSSFADLGLAVFTASGSVVAGSWASSSTNGLNTLLAIHRLSGIDISNPMAATPTTTSYYTDDGDYSSPSISVSEGDLILACMHQPQSTTLPPNSPQSGYVRVLTTNTSETMTSTLSTVATATGATGDISHGTSSAYQGRCALTLAFNPAA